MILFQHSKATVLSIWEQQVLFLMFLLCGEQQEMKPFIGEKFLKAWEYFEWVLLLIKDLKKHYCQQAQ